MSQPVYHGPPHSAGNMPMHHNRNGNEAFKGNRNWSPRANHFGGGPPPPVRSMPPHVPPPHAHIMAGGYFGPNPGSPANMRHPYPHGMASPTNPGSMGPAPAGPPPNAAYFGGPMNYPGHRNSTGGYLSEPPHHERALGFNQGRNPVPWDAAAQAHNAPNAAAKPTSPHDEIETSSSSSSSPQGADPPSLNTSPSADSDLHDQKDKPADSPPPFLDAASILCSMKTSSGPPRPDVSVFPSSTIPHYQDWSARMPDRLSIPEDQKELNSLHCFVRASCIELFATPIGKLNSYSSTPSVSTGEDTGTIDSHVASSTGTGANSNESPSQKTPSSTEGKENSPKEPQVMDRPASPTFLRVGLRCVHCARIQRETIARSKNKNGHPILRGNAPMGTFYPKSLAEIYNLVNRWQRVHFRKCKNVPPPIRHQFDDLKRSDKSRGKRDYWITSAKKLGLVDDVKGGRGIRFMPPPPPPPPLPPMNPYYM